MPTDNTKINTGIDNNEFLSVLQSKIMQSSGGVSSNVGEVDSLIGSAISDIKAGQEGSQQSIRSQFARERTATQESGRAQIAGEMESRRGFATNTALFKSMNDNLDKSLRDLDQREQEALASGNAQAADSIAELKVQQLTLKTQAMQNTFTNLLSAATLFNQVTQNQKQLDLTKSQQSFAQQQAVSNIALKYGLTVNEGDTIETITARAMPFASKQQQAELAKLQADTNLANANAQKALTGSDFVVDSITAPAMASTFYSLMSQGRSVEAQAMMANILDKGGAKGFAAVQKSLNQQVAGEFSDANLSTSITEMYNSGQSLGDIIKTTQDNPFATSEQKQRAQKIAEKLQPKTESWFSGFFKNQKQQKPQSASTIKYGENIQLPNPFNL